MKLTKILSILTVFLLGFFSANFVNYYLVYGLESPFPVNSSFLGFSLSKAKTPSDFIKEKQISVYNHGVVINVEGASISSYAPTGSMKPVLDKGSSGIRIKPRAEQDIHIGDIISFRKDGSLIVHRIIDKGVDEKGAYFITKGDNNSISDGKIRFKDIEYKTIGVIW